MTLRVLIATLAALALLTAPAAAEESDAMKQHRKIQEERNKQADDAYRHATKNTAGPAKAVKVDPWGDVRQSEPAKKK